MRADFTLYTPEYISVVMSLRKPQKKSLEILDIIVNSVNLKKGMNLQAALGAVKALYPTCTDFERDFMSLTFALATGVSWAHLSHTSIHSIISRISLLSLRIPLYIISSAVI